MMNVVRAVGRELNAAAPSGKVLTLFSICIFHILWDFFSQRNHLSI